MCQKWVDFVCLLIGKKGANSQIDSHLPVISMIFFVIIAAYGRKIGVSDLVGGGGWGGGLRL